MTDIINKAIQFEYQDYLLYGTLNSIIVYGKRPYQKRETINIDGIDRSKLKNIGFIGISMKYHIKTLISYDFNGAEYGLFPYTIIRHLNNGKYLVKNILDGKELVKFTDFDFILNKPDQFIDKDNHNTSVLKNRFMYLLSILCDKIDKTINFDEYIAQNETKCNDIDDTETPNNKKSNKKVTFDIESDTDDESNGGSNSGDESNTEDYTDDDSGTDSDDNNQDNKDKKIHILTNTDIDVVTSIDRLENRLKHIENYSSEIYNGKHPDSCCSWISHICIFLFISVSIFIYFNLLNKLIINI
jgi:hypothetical protein